MALVAVIAGTLGALSASAAQPAAITRPAPIVSQARPFAAGHAAVRAQPASLDAVLAAAASGSKVRHHKHARPTNKQIARNMLHKFHWGQRQFPYLNQLWSRESSWNIHALNAYSGAYGIPQAVPGAKMASAGPRWQTSPWTQIRWGLRYIKDRYGSPEGAWNHELATGWY